MRAISLLLAAALITAGAAHAATNYPVPVTMAATATQENSFQSDLCVASAGGGYANTMVTIGLSLPLGDQSCARLRKAKMLVILGLQEAAIQLMCQDTAVSKAMDAAGTPCSSQVAPRPLALAPVSIITPLFPGLVVEDSRTFLWPK
jgi:hypothetical protein